MSVLIKGMEIPSSCNACMFDVYGLCLINKNLEAEDELTHSCPLIEVPEDRLFYVHDNVLYEATVKMSEGKTIKIPPIKTESEDE